MKEKIFLYYTSDLHSHFENWPQIVGYFNKKKSKHEEQNETYWLLDNGDHADRFHPITEGLMGKGNVELLNEAGYSFANLGNNEGITLSHEDLYHLYDEADFDVVCSNLHMLQGEKPNWLKPYVIKETAKGTKVGVLGLTAPFETFYKMLGWSIEPPLEALERYYKEILEQADIFVLLSHLGIHDDENIAQTYPGIDVIIGGHTHHLFQNGEHYGDSILTAAGKYGTHLGEVILEWDHIDQKLTKKEAYAVSTESLSKDLKVTKDVEMMKDRAVKHLQEVVTTLSSPLHVAWFKQTPLMKSLTEELQRWTGADIGMLNAGVLLDNLGEGEVTYEDVHRICPHPMNPCKVEVTGEELLEIIRVGHTKKLTEIRLKGLGFRGEVIGSMIFTGVDIETIASTDGEVRVRKVTLGGQPLKRKEMYTLATADTFTFGRLFPEIAYSKKKVYYMPELLRDVLAKALSDYQNESER
ncbi:bifunctional metallophosphatase/5'-nucleotidase [Halobacillus sp. A1]|uniref:bifunctional metallophosphatase/5'-nucleotidase n=1 Tax=Halobacillus sp. A1 TaxID=2880262 RepID=UPI0020A638D3|nr:bifunctional UDP-sugar hydrolase/5'-nucleotidase [Halobacillus sp. A1]MCP3032802.1 bifunctional metallophosphatase/5'-nucleotidase [Halobacillus sp. A1]